MATSNEKAQIPTSQPSNGGPLSPMANGGVEDAPAPPAEQKAGQAAPTAPTESPGTAGTVALVAEKVSHTDSQEPSASSTSQQAPSSVPPTHEVVDQGSLSSDNTHTVVAPPSQPSKEKSALEPISSPKSASKANGKPTANGHAKTPSKKPKRSFFARFSRLIPCIGPSKAHPLEDEVERPATKPVQPSQSIPEKAPTPKEKETVLSSEVPPKTPTEPAAGSGVVPSTDDVPAPLAVVPVAPLISTPDGDVVHPPSPTKSLLPEDETEGVTSGAVQPPGSTIEPLSHTQTHDTASTSQGSGDGEGEDSEGSYTDDDLDEIALEAEDEEERLILSGGAGIPIGPDGNPKPLLPPLLPQHAGRKCLVLDLDETLVHSSFKSISQADYVVPVEIEFNWHNVYVIKRPGVDNFLKKMGEIYEIVVFTASLSKYADPVLDKLDIHQVVTHRLFRESCFNHRGNYVKDLSQLGRPIENTIILDNSPASYIFHPNNAVPVSSWFNDPHDTELTDLIPFLGDLSEVDDIRGVLDGGLDGL